MPGTRVDPYLSGNFRVEIDNTSASSFSEVHGLEISVEPVDYREGTDVPLSVRKLPGVVTYSNITLKRGYTQNQDLWAWMKNILNGVIDRRNGSIVLEDQERNEVVRWNFKNAWPCKYAGPSLHANSNEVAIETLELCCEQIELATGA